MNDNHTNHNQTRQRKCAQPLAIQNERKQAKDFLNDNK